MIEQLHNYLPGITIIGALTIIQIVPIKINPWSWIAELIRKALGTDGLKNDLTRLDGRINSLDYKLDERIAQVKRDNARTRSKVIRKEIIDFSEELRRGKQYSVSEFEEVARIVDEYRTIINTHKFKNSYCEAQMKFIEEQMKKRGIEHEETFDE